MGPNVKTVENKSQATPFANQFLQQLMGFLNQQKGAQTVGPNQAGGVGNQAQQTAGANPFNLGVNTASGVQDNSDQLISAVQNKNASALKRSVADQREGAGVMGDRFSSGQARGEGLLRSENQGNLDQLIAGILTEQGARKTQATQFDVNANNQRFGQLAGVAGQGILPSDNIVTPSIGSQLFTTALNIGSSFLTGKAGAPDATPKATGRPNTPNLPASAYPAANNYAGVAFDPALLGL